MSNDTRFEWDSTMSPLVKALYRLAEGREIRLAGVPSGEVLTAQTGSSGSPFYVRVKGVPMTAANLAKMLENRPTRGEIVGRSVSSLQRLADLIARHYLFFDEPLSFVTLTYGKEVPSWEIANRHFKVWRDRLRRLYPNVCGIWVSETQKRGAPHFHLVLNTIDKELRAKVLEAWLAVAGLNGNIERHRRRYAVDVKTVGDGANHRANIAIYMAKSLEQNLRLDLIKSKQQERAQKRGRTYGVINRKALKEFESELGSEWWSQEQMDRHLTGLFSEQGILRDLDKAKTIEYVNGSTGEVGLLVCFRHWQLGG